MIVQIKNDNTQYIYTADASKDYLNIAKALGLGSGAGLASYVTTSPIEFTNANGAKVNAVRINGYSRLSYYVMNDTVKLDIKHKGNLTKDMFKTIYACAKITDSEGNVYYSGVVGYSPERYAFSNYSKTNLPYTAALAKALAVYGDAARSAFNKK